MFSLRSSPIAGCHEIEPRVSEDLRGRFVKVFHRGAFESLGLEANFAEEYYSVSRHGVIRGMHFQAPPEDHVKVVYCVQGSVFDVVLDLRQGSPTYGHTVSFMLSAEQGNLLYIPKGLAHGFCVVSETATMVYKTTTVYSPEQDQGILWSSIGVSWPVTTPLLSPRDQGFLAFSDFNTPFNLAHEGHD